MTRLQLHYFSIIPEFVSAAVQEGCTLKTLQLYENRLSIDDAQQLAILMEQSKSLETIILNDCEIDCSAAKVLARGLENSTTLTTMNVWDNCIGEEGGRALAMALEKNETLTTLNLWGNRIGNEGAKAFAQMLRTNTTLRDLIFVYNEIGDEGGDELVDALGCSSVKNGGSIRNLDLFGNPLDPVIITEVYAAIGGLSNGREDDDDAWRGVELDKGCFGGGGGGVDAESTDSPTGVEEVSGCCWTTVVMN